MMQALAATQSGDLRTTLHGEWAVCAPLYAIYLSVVSRVPWRGTYSAPDIT